MASQEALQLAGPGLYYILPLLVLLVPWTRLLLFYNEEKRGKTGGKAMHECLNIAAISLVSSLGYLCMGLILILHRVLGQEHASAQRTWTATTFVGLLWLFMVTRSFINIIGLVLVIREYANYNPHAAVVSFKLDKTTGGFFTVAVFLCDPFIHFLMSWEKTIQHISKANKDGLDIARTADDSEPVVTPYISWTCTCGTDLIVALFYLSGVLGIRIDCMAVPMMWMYIACITWLTVAFLYKQLIMKAPQRSKSQPAPLEDRPPAPLEDRPPAQMEDILEEYVKKCPKETWELVSPGTYKIGGKHIRVLNGDVMVRVGGGWEKLRIFLRRHTAQEAQGRRNFELRPQLQPLRDLLTVVDSKH